MTDWFTEEDVGMVAQIIEPEWFMMNSDGTHGLDNYPGQHKNIRRPNDGTQHE